MTVVEDYQEQTEALAASTVAGVLALYAAMQAGGLAPATVVPVMASVIARANAAATTLADVAVSAQIEVASGVPTPPTGIAPSDDTERLVKAVQTILDDLDEDQADEPDDDQDHAEERHDEDQPDDLDEDQADEFDDDEDQPDDDQDHADDLDDDDEDEDEDEGHDDEPHEDHTDEDHAEEPREDHAEEPHQDHAEEPHQGHADEDHAEEPDPADTAANRLERLARAEPLETGQAVTVEIIDRLPQVEGWRRKLDADPCERCQRWAEDGRVFPTGHHFKRHLNCNCQQEIITATT